MAQRESLGLRCARPLNAIAHFTPFVYTNAGTTGPFEAKGRPSSRLRLSGDEAASPSG
jgi:hypothetical protein